MSKKLIGILFIMILWFSFGIAWAASQLEIKAPCGGEADLLQNVMKYSGTDSQLVEVHWEDSVFQNGEKEQAKTGQKPALPRVLKSVHLTVNLNQNYIVANKKVAVYYDESTSATCDFLEWDRKAALMKLSGRVTIIYKDWTIKGSRVEGQLDKELFTVYGPVEAFNQSDIVRGGKLVFDRGNQKAIISDNALLVRGKNEMAAPEITYFFDTNEVLASGAVRTRIINETK
jgi:lipopolysaccharide export system protein LptA